ncbi:MAG: hypothetical protein LBD20_07060 [Spirochaetaceae bacterium]|jgi:hypothetical protein|nr:hypothetical protein [Spirochaetaceae bacterium]
MKQALFLLALSTLSLNLVLHFGVCAREIFFEREQNIRPYIFRAVYIFLSVLILWHLAIYILLPLTLGFVCYFLLFPLCFLLYYIFDRTAGFIYTKDSRTKKEAPVEIYQSEKPDTVPFVLFVYIALVLTMKLALNSFEAVVLAAGFSAGMLFAVLLLKAIRSRIAKEDAPPTLRGLPLLFVSMGILSLVFSALAAVILL